MSLSFIFPGQASQYIGMGKDLYEKSDVAKELFNNACDILGYDIKKICFEGPEDELKQTKITQPAIFIHSSILSTLLNKLQPNMCAGHSLGEYSALHCAQSISFEDGLKLVALRGKLMHEAGLQNPGSMAVIIGIDSDKIKSICETSSDKGTINPANFNSKEQIVISGTKEAIQKAMQIAKEAGAKIVKELLVSAAFHSPLMESAKANLNFALENTAFKDVAFPIYANISAKPSLKASEIKNNLSKQITSPVYWLDTINNMTNNGMDIAVEVGPGKVLQGLLKKINPNIKIFGVDKFEDIEELYKTI
jgi:[acyl-carrier-protein] S-malonyltransferase